MSSQDNFDSSQNINEMRNKSVAKQAGLKEKFDKYNRGKNEKRQLEEERAKAAPTGNESDKCPKSDTYQKASDAQTSEASEEVSDSIDAKDSATDAGDTDSNLPKEKPETEQTDEKKEDSAVENDDGSIQDIEASFASPTEKPETEQADEKKEDSAGENDDGSIQDIEASFASPTEKPETEQADEKKEDSAGENEDGSIQDTEASSASPTEKSVTEQTDEKKEGSTDTKKTFSESSFGEQSKPHPFTTTSLDKAKTPSKEEPPSVLLGKERFKNAKQDVSIEYKVLRMKLEDGEKQDWEKCRMDDFSKATEEEMGLSFDPEASILKVKPTKAGDFTIIFSRGSKYRLEYRLTVIADPRKLWDAKEPAKDSPYPKEHRDSDMIKVGGRVLAGASIRGRSHARDGTHRDDDFIIRELADGWTLMVVADGAGSAKFSREGSRILVDTMHSFIKEQIDSENGLAAINDEAAGSIEGDAKIDRKNNPLINGALSSLKNIQKEADKEEARTKDFNTTIISCLFKDFGEKTFIYSFCIGDGAIFAIEAETGNVKPLNTADSGEFAGQTVFLTTPQVWEDSKSLFGRIKVEVVSRPVGIISMTDGVSDPLLPDIEQIDEAKHTDLLLNGREGEDPQEGLLSTLREMVEKDDAKILEEWLDFYVAKHHDDRSIAVSFDPQFIS